MKVMVGIVIAVLGLTTAYAAQTGRGQDPDKPGDFGARQAPGAARKVIVERGKPLLPQVRESDTVVEFERVVTSSLGALPEGMTEIEAMTKGSAVVAVVQVIESRGQLARSQDWIESTVSARVLQALKRGAPGKGAADDALLFHSDGGEIKVGGKVIRARNATAKRLAVGQRYLIFAEDTPTGLHVANSAMFLIDGDTLVPMVPSAMHSALPKSLSKITEEISYWAAIK